MSIVLFGSTASMVVDVEETCARLGMHVIAIVKNVAGTDYAISAGSIVAADDVTPEIASCPFIIPIFTPGHRLAALEDASRRGFGALITVVDPTSAVARSTTLGAGTYVNAGAVVGGASTIGKCVFINRSASIGHHVAIDEFAAVGPNATIAGAVRIGRGTVIGAGAIVLPAIEIGNNVVVAAGAVVRAPIADHCLVAGNPARVVKTNYAGYRNMSV